MYIQDRRRCILWPNLGSDMPIFLPYSTDHSDQPRYNVRWEHICKYHEVGLSVAILEAGYHRHYLHCRQANYLLSRNIFYGQGCLAFLPTPSLCPITWNEMTTIVEKKKFLLTFPKSFHWETVSETGASLIFRSWLLKRSLSEPIRNAREVNVN